MIVINDNIYSNVNNFECSGECSKIIINNWTTNLYKIHEINFKFKSERWL